MTDAGREADERPTMLHELKTDPQPFADVFHSFKTFEIRRDDRDYGVGDTLILWETESTGAEMKEGAPLVYTGRRVSAHVTHILRGPIYGLADGWCILSIGDCIGAMQQTPPKAAK